jgi:hypothetical protein
MKRLILTIVLLSFTAISFADAEKFIKFRDNPEEQKRLESFVSKRVGPPESYFVINNNKFLVSITSVGRIAQGLYFVDLSSSHIERIVGGFPELKKEFRNKNTTVLIFANTGLNRGQMWTQYYEINFPETNNTDQSFGRSNLINVVEDGESGFCGGDKHRAKSINLTKATRIRSYTFSDKNIDSIPDILFNVDEMDCQSWEKRSYQVIYIFKNGKYEKQI